MEDSMREDFACLFPFQGLKKVSGPAMVRRGVSFTTEILFSGSFQADETSPRGGNLNGHRNSADDDTSSTNTVLTECSDEELDEEDDLTRKQQETLQQKFTQQQKLFAERDRLLNRLDGTQSPALMSLLRQREMIVRQQERELLLLFHLQDTDDIPDDDDKGECECDSLSDDEDFDDDSTVWHETTSGELPPASVSNETKEVAVSSSPPPPTSSFGAWAWSVYNTAMWETRITVPAVLSMFAHSLAHAGMYDVMLVLAEQLKKLASINLFSGNAGFLSDVSVYLVGVAMMRSSGYLYWWLNSRDYLCLRLEMHNRLQLGDWEARFMLWIKRHEVLRALLYMSGYSICYNVTFEWYEKWYYSFMKNEEEITVSDVVPTVDVSTDQFGYWETLTYWVERVVVEPEFEPIRCVIVCSSVAIVSILCLRWYGFGFFSKY